MQYKLYFLKSLQFLPIVFNLLNLKWLNYYPTCRNTLIENYNTSFFLRWLANVNTSLSTNQNAVLGYIAKYCSKTKISSLFFKDFLKKILKIINSKSLIFLLATKILNELIFEQDSLVQKIYHYLLN